METDRAAITAILRKYAAYCNNGDFESWIALWEANGCQMPPDTPSRVGVDAIRKAMQPAFEGMTWESDEMIRSLAIAIYRSSLTSLENVAR